MFLDKREPIDPENAPGVIVHRPPVWGNEAAVTDDHAYPNGASWSFYHFTESAEVDKVWVDVLDVYGGILATYPPTLWLWLELGMPAETEEK